MALLKKKDILVAIAEALELPPTQVGEDASSETIDAWDSIGHLGILTQIDKAANGRAASLQDLAAATSFADIHRILQGNGLAE